MPTADELIRNTMHERAAAVTADTLQHSRQRDFDAHEISKRPRLQPPLLLAAAASIVAVVAIAFGIGAIGGSGSDTQHVATGGTNGLTGIRWVLTGIRADRPTSIPRDYHGHLQFDSNGHFHGLNGLNAIDGTYHASGDKITIKLDVSGAAGSSGNNPAIAAMNSLYIASTNSAADVTSTYSVTDSALTVVTRRWTLTFTGSEAPNSTPLPSGSATPSRSSH